MKHLLGRIKAAVIAFHHREPLLHVGYLGAAVLEGHGLYAGMAGALAVCVVLGLLVGEH